jgi:hypothetical protein
MGADTAGVQTVEPSAYVFEYKNVFYQTKQCSILSLGPSGRQIGKITSTLYTFRCECIKPVAMIKYFPVRSQTKDWYSFHSNSCC